MPDRKENGRVIDKCLENNTGEQNIPNSKLWWLISGKNSYADF